MAAIGLSLLGILVALGVPLFVEGNLRHRSAVDRYPDQIPLRIHRGERMRRAGTRETGELDRSPPSLPAHEPSLAAR